MRSESYLKTTIPPVSASLEYCVKDNLFDEKSSLGVGIYAGYFAQKWKDGSFGALGDLDLKYSDFVVGVRGALHYQFVEKLDTYGGVAMAMTLYRQAVIMATIRYRQVPLQPGYMSGGVIISQINLP